jgi:hypothetical protein
VATALSVVCAAAPAQAYIYWTSNAEPQSVGRANLDGGGVDKTFITGVSTTFGLAVDAAHVYWANSHGGVGRAAIDGTNVDQGFIADGNPVAVALDASHVYWADLSHSIGRADLDGTGADQNYVTDEDGTLDPKEVAVDDEHVYWINGAAGTISRANIDGTGIDEGWISTGSTETHAVAVDGGHVYWDDGFTNTIGRANLDGTGVEPRFITAVSDPVGIAVDGHHIYWSSNVGDSIGRANLDGSGVNRTFVTGISGASLAVDGLGPTATPAPPGPPKPPAKALKGAINLALFGRRVHGYREVLSGTVGSADASSDNLSFGLVKANRRRTFTESHTWSVALAPGTYAIDRAKASITVTDPLGPGGADGELNFTFSGRPRLKHMACGVTQHVVTGTFKGTVRIRVDDKFFKTVIVKRMSGTARDTQTRPARRCSAPPRCPPTSYTINAAGTYRATSPHILLTAITPTSRGGGHASEAVLFSEPTDGTPFLNIAHSMIVVRARPFLRSDPSLRSATIRSPGGLLAGTLRFKRAGRLIKSGPARDCRRHRFQATNRALRVTGGRITARFDSIGKVSFDRRDVRTAGMTGLRRTR